MNKNWILAVGAVAIGCGGSGFDFYVRDRVAQGSLSGSDPYDGGTYYDAYLVEAVATGQGIINMEGHECTSCQEDGEVLDTELYVKRPNGDDVATDKDSGGGEDARVVFPVQNGDRFRIVATSGPASQRGYYRLTVSDTLRIVERLER
jgi:hypothetical protein